MTKHYLDLLIARIEAGNAVSPVHISPWVCQNTSWEWHSKGFCQHILAAYEGDMVAAKAFHDALLPGWGWRIGTCYLSDDAFVFPDFNSPTDGERLKRDVSMLVDGMEWADFTDIDQRPAGNPARAWLLSILVACRGLELLREAKP